ncbi:MAG TPA: hypothetical protein VGA36_01680, partial [Nitriliruptorales bacterium]
MNPLGGSSADPFPEPVRRLVGTVAIIGAAAVAMVAVAGGPSRAPPVTLPLVGLTALAVWLPVRYRRRDGAHGLTLDEAVLVAMLFTLPTGLVPLAHVAGTLLGHVLLRTHPLKLAFNLGAIGAGTGAATLVFHAIGTGPQVLHPRSLLATLLATGVLNLTTLACSAELFRRIDDTPWRRTVVDVGPLNALTWLGTSTGGLFLAVSMSQGIMAAVLATGLVVSLYQGFVGYARLLDERSRDDRATGLASDLLDGVSSTSSGAFLERLAEAFSAEGAALVLTDGHGAHWLLQYRGQLESRDEHLDEDHPVARALAEDRAIAVRTTALTGLDGSSHDLLVAPFGPSGERIGVLAVIDRR